MMMMNKMVEWEDGPHREMAVDVPDSFVPRNKTPPRYPPSKPSTLNKTAKNGGPASTTSGGSVTSSLPTVGNGSSSGGVGVSSVVVTKLPNQNGTPGKPIPPPRGSENVVKDWTGSSNANTQVPPHALPRTTIVNNNNLANNNNNNNVSNNNKTSAPTIVPPSKDEAERIRKYQVK